MHDNHLPELSSEFGTHLRRTRRQLLEMSAPGTILQPGGAHLPGTFPVPHIEQGLDGRSITEALIETFVVSPDAELSPTGQDAELIEAWLPTAASFARSVIEATLRADVAIEGDSYLTVSLTPCDQIIGDPHFDDDIYAPDSGVGLVAIAANVGGSRVACEPIVSNPPLPGIPLDVPDETFEAFTAGRLSLQQSAADRIVIFPQFAQLHAGPRLADAGVAGVRSLLVFRAATTEILL